MIIKWIGKMRTKKRKIGRHLCEKCGKDLVISVHPYLRDGLRKNKTICECNKEQWRRWDEYKKKRMKKLWVNK
jgi:hypothetical protein